MFEVLTRITWTTLRSPFVGPISRTPSMHDADMRGASLNCHADLHRIQVSVT